MATITRTQAKTLHKDLPPGGVWRTIRGNHVYIKDGAIIAGAGVKAGKPVKLTKKELAAHFEALQKESKKSAAKTKKPADKKKPAAKKTAKTTPTKAKKVASEDGKGRAAKAAGKRGSGAVAADAKSAVQATPAGKGAKGGKAAAAKTDSGKGKAKAPAAEPRQAKPGDVKPSDALIDSTRKFKAKEYKEWFTSLSAQDMRKVMRMKDVPKSHYQVGSALVGSAKDAQHILDVFHHLRALAGLSKTEAGKTRKGVKDTRHKAQEGREVAYDVGEKVGGARKDLASVSQRFEAEPTAQDLETLEKEYPEMAQKLVNKKNLLKPLDWNTEHANGVDVEVALAKKLIYDRIATEPAGNDALNRLLYFNAIQNIQRVLEPIKTWDELRNATSELGSYMRKETPKELQYAGFRVENAMKKLQNDNPREFDLTEHGAYYDKAREKWVIPKDAKDKWRAAQQKKVEEALARYAETKAANMAPLGLPLGEKFHNFFTDYESRNRTYDTIRKKRLTWDKHFESIGQKRGGTSEGVEGERKMRPGEERAKIPVVEAKRVGGKAVKVAKPEDMVKAFGFRGVEFGNYVNDEDGKHHLVKASEAFSDLADILGLAPKDVSLNGRLAMAFGARGKGGALAHYEAVSKVINMTRDAGAGTLAHEWGHAMDNILHAESTGKPSIGFASDGIGTEGSPEVREAYEGVMRAMMQGDGMKEIPYNGKAYRGYPSRYNEYAKGAKQFRAVWAEERKKLEERRDAALKLLGYYGTPDPKKVQKAMKEWDKNIEDHYHSLAYAFTQAGKKVEPLRVPTGKSEYKTNADALCGGRNGYWNRKHEMFARAFEAYVLDKLAKAGRRNDYLVYGTTNPMAYPQGKEREVINAAFDKLMEAVRNSGAIRKGLKIQLLKAFFTSDELRKKVEEVLEFRPEFRPDYAARLAVLKSRRDPDGIEPQSAITERNAYDIDHETDPSEVIYIPVNRLNMVYQTDEATDWDKVKENMDKMRAGIGLKPVEIGYDYDVHDGHHRWIASKELDYTHVPCVVKGKDEAERQAAIARYRELWKSLHYGDELRKALVELDYESDAAQRMAKERVLKSLIPDPAVGTYPDDFMYRGVGQKELEFILRHGFIQSKGKGNDDDKGNKDTCFTCLYQQAEGYALWNYIEYNEPAAYVIIVPRPPWVYEDEHGELISDRPVPFDFGSVVYIPHPDSERRIGA